MLFKKIVGQTKLKNQFIDEINRSKISHAQLFVGANGYGLLPLALAYAQYLFCENRQKNDSCGMCSSCLKVDKLQHADLHFVFPVVQAIDKSSDPFLKKWREVIYDNPYFSLSKWIAATDTKMRTPIIGVEESVHILKKLSLTSFEGAYKVVIIWLPETMNISAANKLLKILEEPTKKTVFILLSESAENLLQTIISRTQIKRVPAIHVDDLCAFLVERHHTEKSTAYSIAGQAEGDLILAESIIKSNNDFEYNREMFIQLMRVCYKKLPTNMMDWADKISEQNKDKQKAFLAYCLHMFRQSLLKNYTENQLTRLSNEETSFLDNFARFITGNNIYDLMDDFNNAVYHIDRNANVRILFTELCFRVMRHLHKA